MLLLVVFAKDTRRAVAGRVPTNIFPASCGNLKILRELFVDVPYIAFSNRSSGSCDNSLSGSTISDLAVIYTFYH